MISSISGSKINNLISWSEITFLTAIHIKIIFPGFLCASSAFCAPCVKKINAKDANDAKDAKKKPGDQSPGLKHKSAKADYYTNSQILLPLLYFLNSLYFRGINFSSILTARNFFQFLSFNNLPIQGSFFSTSSISHAH